MSNSEKKLIRTSKTFGTQTNVDHSVFAGIADGEKIGPDTPKGTRVLVAKYPDNYKLYLYEYVNPGSPSYPRGGVKIWNATFGQMQSFYLESVLIHPIPSLHKFKDVVEIDVDNLEQIEDNKKVKRK
jgi:hypothetical protein